MGRSSLDAMQKVVAGTKTELKQPLSLPKDVSSQVVQAELGLINAVSSFTANKAPDSQAQRSLFESLNTHTRSRALALLQWRTQNNRSLSQKRHHQARTNFLAWESAWLPLWKAEVDITYRLQKNALSRSQSSSSSNFVREVLALQAQANAIKTPKELSALQDIASRRLTLLARTAEQLDRLGRGESRGAITRIRRLNKEQSELGNQLQEQRLSQLSVLAK